ncbi:MAG: DUF1573 domain-containing protein [Candidatus Omnitrophota bacterium]
MHIKRLKRIFTNPPANKLTLRVLFTGVFFLLFLSPARAIKFDSISWEAGKIDLTRQIEKKVTVINDAQESVELLTRVSCECVSVYPKTFSLLPGESATLRIIFNPEGEEGAVRHSVYFETSAGDFINYFISVDVEPGFDIYFFYDENCAKCGRIIRELEKLESEYSFRLRKLLISERRNFEFMAQLEKNLDVKKDRFPVLAVGGVLLAGSDEIISGAEAALAQFSSYPPDTIVFDTNAGRAAILDKYGKLKFLPVAAAALIDGVNPCAFAGIIFLISYMSFVMKKPKREIIVFGAGYCFGVGVLYFLFGLGLLEIARELALMKAAGRVFYFLMAALTFVLAVLSVRDAVVFRQGGEAALKVPDAVRDRMRRVSSKMLGRGTTFLYAFLIGGIVSSFEFVCTGQIYLPTIAYVVSATTYRAQAVFSLFLYSVLFTLPLLAVFVFVFAGMSSVGMITFLKKHVVAAKLLNAFLFGSFAAYLFFFAMGG